MNPPEWAAAAAGAVIAGVAMMLKEWVPGVARWATGRAERERTREEQLRADLREAEARADAEALKADAEAAKRRQLAEFASVLIRRLIDQGVSRDDPDLRWPY